MRAASSTFEKPGAEMSPMNATPSKALSTQNIFLDVLADGVGVLSDGGICFSDSVKNLCAGKTSKWCFLTHQ
jgi:hypothetical protein